MTVFLYYYIGDAMIRVKTKILYSDRYKDGDSFDAAIERWIEKGWHLADVAQDFENCGDAAGAILWQTDLKNSR